MLLLFFENKLKDEQARINKQPTKKKRKETFLSTTIWLYIAVEIEIRLHRF